MLQETNELLTRVGPDAPMGKLMREYWIPACQSSELEADAAPTRLMLLGEKLIAFRTTRGEVGVMDHRCPHRCASLFFGRNEDGALRCVYHGWQFDVNGKCLDQPNVPPGQEYKDKVRAKAYRVVERNGIVWTYMGAGEPPPLPAMEPVLLGAEETSITQVLRECNWLQGLEGDIDTSHFSFLHGGSVRKEDVDPDSPSRFVYLDTRPKYHVSETDWGTMYAAYRPADAGNTYYRIAHFVFPFWTLIPDGPIADYIFGEAWVPMDDNHTMVWSVRWNVTRSSARTLKDGSAVPGLAKTTPYLPNSNDWFGRWRYAANRDNDYNIDRDKQRHLTYSGVDGVDMQDQLVTESMGPIVDRTFENLGPSDRMIVKTRRRMLDAISGHQAGEPPPGSRNPECHHNVRGGDFVAPEALDWRHAYVKQLEEGRNPTGVRRSFAGILAPA